MIVEFLFLFPQEVGEEALLPIENVHSYFRSI